MIRVATLRAACSKKVCDLLNIVKMRTTPIPTMREWSGGTYEPYHFADTTLLLSKDSRKIGIYNLATVGIGD